SCFACALLFLLYRSCHVRHLDSFPTRRSSDLYIMQYNLSVQRALPGNWDLTLGYAGSHGLHLIRVADANLESGGARESLHSRARSEEHTSELQSRGHLVCRLLLEKKKFTLSLS